MPPMGRMMRANMHPEKADAGALKKILVYCKRYLPAVAVALVMGICSAYATIIGPEKISDLINEIMKGIMSEVDMEAFKNICFTLAAIYGAGSLLSYMQHFITATVTQYTSRRLRTDIDRKINRLPLRYFDTTTRGDILSRVTNDVDTISQTLSTSSANLINSLTLFIGVIWKMFDTNWLLALVTIASSFLGFFFMGIILRQSQKYFNRKQTDLGAMNGHIEEIYTNHNIVHAFGAKGIETEKFNTINERLYDSNWRSQFLSGMMFPVMGFVGNLAYALIFIIGVAFIVNGNDKVTLGTIMAFVIYAKLFSQPLSTFAQSMTQLQQASAASKRVFEMLESEEMPDESAKTAVPAGVKGNVEFRNVKFGYNPDKTIIHDFSAKLSAGQKVAIVGPTGAGKTTMVNLLMRFYDIDEGDILIDGVSVNDMKRENVHDLFDMILQDTWLFEGTIRDNLVYNRENVTDEELDRACAAVGLSHFIATLPDSYDTLLSDSLNLSEGQKQQLTIARAMIKDAPLLILDEATSSVDTRTELVIQEAMDKLTEGRTSFVIAHRLSTIKNADIILVMKDGDIIEQGNHSELLEKKGFYADLYNSQFVVA
ncbi:MAG: ABC transporter ATP-binding protein/permease [Oscillospiraceae bacterium]|nr:ABC transporter ATP-binding protein/permease [Oscillospiraceae bacterium]